MPETRIALIMGGGVSLGSFSGGALAQVVRLLKEVQRGPAKIDVVSGASAGSMTLGVVVYHLFKGSSDDDIETSLREAWVDRIRFDTLAPSDLEGYESPSLFSDAIIHDIANTAIAVDEWPDPSPAPHSLFAEGTRVSFSLTNLNGIPVRTEGQIIRQPDAGGGPVSGPDSVFADAVQTTFHHDSIRFALYREAPGDSAQEPPGDGVRSLYPWDREERKDAWNVFRSAAIASGAFPAAFPPFRLRRNRGEYGRWWPENLDSDQFTFDYVDGGITRNEPLREAIQMAAEQDAGKDVERVFILIDPNVSGTSEIYPLSHNQSLSLKKKYDDEWEVKSISLSRPDYKSRLFGVMGRFGGVLASQATFRDWLKAARFNSQVEWKEDLVEILDELDMEANAVTKTDMDKLLTKIYRQKRFRAPSADLTEDQAIRIDEQIRRDVSERSATGDADDARAKLKLLVELVGNLKGKRELKMVAITPASIERGGEHRIAGNFLANFGGFLKKEYREYDFSVGKYLAAKVLDAPVGTARRLLKEDIPDLPDPGSLEPDPSLRNLDKDRKEQFKAFVKNHLDQALPKIPFLKSLIGFVPLPFSFYRNKIRNRLVDQIMDSLMADQGGEAVHLLLRFQNVNDRVYLKGFKGEDGKADDNRVIETLLGIRKFREGGIRYELFGPHLKKDEETGAHSFEFYEKRQPFWNRDRLALSIPVEGEDTEWFQRVRRSGMPVLIRNLDENDPETLMPGQVRSERDEN